MAILARHADTLEFPKIRALLRRQTSFSASEALADALAPTTDPEAIEREQDAVAEACRLLEARPGSGIRGAHDIRGHVRHAELAGSLQPWQLLEIAATIASGRAIRNLLLREELRVPTLAEQARRILDLGPIEDAIRIALDDDGAILDTASARLQAIRQQLRTAHERLVRRLNELVASQSVREALQEPVVTMRAGRYVVPVKADFRGRVPGIVHDQSGSGATVFVEPLAVIELANRWREMTLQEQEEIELILRDLSARVGQAAPDLVELVEALALIDLTFAKAKLAEAMDASRPVLRAIPPLSQGEGRGEGWPAGEQQPEDVVFLRRARHPLLAGGVVPIDVRLGRDFDILLISGPNTGGKTVALKTVGLLALMAQAGLQIPADPGSQLAVFSGIYADIGDEQSIEQSLSTFSSHVSHIIEILSVADSGSIALLDEIGAGTDPQEGSALGRALLGFLKERRIYTVATTHSSELKIFASSTPRVQNASVEFDVETLRPTYRLNIGLPGQSNAITIAERLGMPSEVVSAAREALQPLDRRTDELLGEIHQQLAQARAERNQAAHLRRESEQTLDELHARLAAVEEERRTIIDRAQRDAAAMVADLERELDLLRRDARGLADERKRAAELQQRLAAVWDEQRSRQRASAPPPAAGLRVGDVIAVESLGLTGFLRSPIEGSDEVEIEVGNMRVWVPAQDVRPAPAAAARAARRVPPSPEVGWGEGERTGRVVSADQRDQAPSLLPPADAQVDLRGLTGEEARAQLDQYLSDAYMDGLHTVRVVHGKGAGVLREVVRELVSGHPLVRAHQVAAPRDGGEGATIVQLVSRV